MMPMVQWTIPGDGRPRAYAGLQGAFNQSEWFSAARAQRVISRFLKTLMMMMAMTMKEDECQLGFQGRCDDGKEDDDEAADRKEGS